MSTEIMDERLFWEKYQETVQRGGITPEKAKWYRVWAERFAKGAKLYWVVDLQSAFFSDPVLFPNESPINARCVHAKMAHKNLKQPQGHDTESRGYTAITVVLSAVGRRQKCRHRCRRLSALLPMIDSDFNSHEVSRI